MNSSCYGRFDLTLIGLLLIFLTGTSINEGSGSGSNKKPYAEEVRGGGEEEAVEGAGGAADVRLGQLGQLLKQRPRSIVVQLVGPGAERLHPALERGAAVAVAAAAVQLVEPVDLLFQRVGRRLQRQPHRLLLVAAQDDASRRRCRLATVVSISGRPSHALSKIIGVQQRPRPSHRVRRSVQRL